VLDLATDSDPRVGIEGDVDLEVKPMRSSTALLQTTSLGPPVNERGINNDERLASGVLGGGKSGNENIDGKTIGYHILVFIRTS